MGKYQIALDRQIATKEVEVVIKNLKSSKTPGSNGFSEEYYRALKQRLVPVLTELFNTILQRNKISDSWKEAKIVVIPKEGKDLTNCASYTISLINVDAQIYAKVLANRLNVILPKFVHPEQSGFIAGRDLSDNIRTPNMIYVVNCCKFY
uniref:Reverse transcriptase domain-containing protein n=1 Tax=Chrysemys picta bellii TaxID=8478 RepID=A0A8C3ILM4_CHRPI